jgi:nitrogen fixation NifU-like protein
MDELRDNFLENIYKDTIMDHYRNPRHSELLERYDFAQEELNPFCGDKILLQLKLNDSFIIQDICAKAEGCTVIKASASLMSMFLTNLHMNEINDRIEKFHLFLKNELPSDEQYLIGCLAELSVVIDHPVRLKCVLLPFRSLEKILKQYKTTV